VLRPISVYRHAVANTPVGSWVRMCRSPKTHDSGLPRVRGGSAPTLKFSRPARRSRTLRPGGSQNRRNDPFHRRLRQYRYLYYRSDCYRLERPLAGWELHPLKIDAFSRRTPTLKSTSPLSAFHP
jgi:hypothetical protein